MKVLHDLPKHQIKILPGGDRLVFSFESAFTHREPITRLPWGGEFLHQMGFTVAGVICKETDWYRSSELHKCLLRMRDEGFFSQYRSTTFIGGSMGGYAALAFAELVPGCRVVSISPQSTLDSKLVPDETRWPEGRAQDWTGAFADGAIGVRSASKAFVLLDNYYRLDRMQVNRISRENVVFLNAPFLGHGLPATFGQMHVLKDIILSCVKGEMTVELFSHYLRTRRETLKYKRHLSHRLAQSSHTEVSIKLARRFLKETSDEYFVSMMALTQAKAGRLDKAFDLMLERPFPAVAK